MIDVEFDWMEVLFQLLLYLGVSYVCDLSVSACSRSGEGVYCNEDDLVSSQSSSPGVTSSSSLPFFPPLFSSSLYLRSLYGNTITSTTTTTTSLTSAWHSFTLSPAARCHLIDASILFPFFSSSSSSPYGVGEGRRRLLTRIPAVDAVVVVVVVVVIVAVAVAAVVVADVGVRTRR